MEQSGEQISSYTAVYMQTKEVICLTNNQTLNSLTTGQQTNQLTEQQHSNEQKNQATGQSKKIRSPVNRQRVN